jgi:hypothetical protein
MHLLYSVAIFKVHGSRAQNMDPAGQPRRVHFEELPELRSEVAEEALDARVPHRHCDSVPQLREARRGRHVVLEQPPRVRSRYRYARPFIHFTPGSLRDSAPLFLR